MQNPEYLTLGQAAKLAPGRPSANAVWRWCRRGIRTRSGERITLTHIRAGGKIFTTAEDLATFFRNVAESDRQHFTPADHVAMSRTLSGSTEKQRQRSIDEASRRLDAKGC